ncbi:hypothetical protein ACMX25_36460 [Caballeronia sp. 15715]|uniref:hypothetical protein n=1 Tax=Caballeronia sp. 15715 TaxID=3391030 RepID=UPI0039E4D87D
MYSEVVSKTRKPWKNNAQIGVTFITILLSQLCSSSAVAENAQSSKDLTICVEGVVDKDRLARALLKEFPVSALALSSTSDPRFVNLSPQRQLFANPASCGADCPASDRTSLKAAAYRVEMMLIGDEADRFSASNPSVDPHEYMRGKNSDNAVKCIGITQTLEAKDEQGGRPQGKDLGPEGQLRIRGSANALGIARPPGDAASSGSASQGAYATVDKATFQLTQDSAAGKRTSNLVTYIGYALPTSIFSSDGSNIDVLTLTPYVGVNRDIVSVSKGSSAKPSANDTADVGLVGQLNFRTGKDINSIMSHDISVRPDYLFDFQDHSRLASLNFSYTPIIQGIANTYAPVLIAGKSGYFAYQPIFVVKTNIGYYTNHGDPPASQGNKDFVRLGGEIGLAFLSQISWLPVDFSFTYVRLYPTNGGVRVGELNCAFSYNFNRYWGLSLKYLHGNREDTAKFEKEWLLALSAKY